MFKPSRLAIALGAAFGAALVSAPSFAQQAPEAAKLERVEVTGSRIKTLGATSSSPITSVGKDDLAIKQPVAVEELVRGLPSAYPAIGPNINNGSNGTASIDLRGMGSNRTLVLINGRRFVPATLGGTVDTNSIPVSLLERVDLVTGGASAVYGADAVAGVVNFVTKRNFSGVEAATLYSETGKGDGGRFKSDLTIGTNLDEGRGNVVLHVGTTRTNPVTLGDRDFSVTSISSRTGRPGGFSPTAAPAVFNFPAASAPTLTGDRVIDPATGLLRVGDGSVPPDGYNTNPPNYFETPLERTQATALGRYKVNDNLEVYGEFFHSRSLVTLNLAPSGTFGQLFSVPIGNPFISPALRGQLCAAYGVAAANCVAGSTTEVSMNIARRFVEAGPRIYSYDNTSNQYTAGVRGDVPFLDGWSYDAYYQSGRADQTLTTGNGFSRSKVQQALRATSTTACTVATGGCVPINLFGGVGSISQPMLNYIAIPTFQTTRVDQRVMAASLSGEVPLLTSPFARNPLALALGYEDRRIIGGNASDNVVQTSGELLGSGAPVPDRKGLIQFKESYVEANMPLAQNLPFARALNLGLGYRNTDFSTAVASQKYDSWKTGLDWSPVRGLRLRGEKQRATRAPNVNELYAPVVTGLATLSSDPCQQTRIVPGDAGRAGTLTNLCQLTGVPTAAIGVVPPPAANQILNTSGGNPNLSPEKADTTTIGVVWEPTFVSNLALTLDYWAIEINGAVSSPTASQVVNGCFDATLNPTRAYNQFCQAISRNPSSGGLSGNGFPGVSTQSSNLGYLNYDGVDLGVNYRLPLKNVGLEGWGRVDFAMNLSYSRRADFKASPVIDTLNYAGHYGIDVGTPYAKIRSNQRATWTWNQLSLGMSWRYIEGTTVQQSGTATNRAGNFLAVNESIPAYNYFDLNASYQVLKNLRIGATVNNLTDKAPPIIGTGIGPGASNFGNTFPSAYDVLGRRYTVTATLNF
jgi:outer membrane receptor protein involved in Fe transport